MTRLLGFLLSLLTSTFRTRASLQAEIAALRHQLAVYQRRGERPIIAPADRLLWAVISRLWSGWRAALYFVQPRTVADWQKKRFREYWWKLSGPRNPGRPRISAELQELIRRMWRANPTWGSPRIVGELRKLGISVAKSTVERYRPRSDGRPSISWRKFLDLHVKDLASIDFFVVPTVRFKILFVFLVLSHDRRRIIHFNVTEHPTAHWTAQQLIEAFPFDTAPRFLLRDGDGIYGPAVKRKIKCLGSEDLVTAPASPWQNPYAERVIGSIRRELLDHVVVLNERHLRRLLSGYVAYYHRWRLHRSLDMDAPNRRAERLAKPNSVAEFPACRGLHHYYIPRAA
jgi:transposase InsO family protein